MALSPGTPHCPISLETDADLSGSEGCSVLIASNYLALDVNGTAALPIGILGESPVDGTGAIGVCPVHISGPARGRAGGTIAAGNLLHGTTTTGRLVVAATGDFYVAQAVEAASAGDFFAVVVKTGQLN